MLSGKTKDKRLVITFEEEKKNPMELRAKCEFKSTTDNITHNFVSEIRLS